MAGEGSVYKRDATTWVAQVSIGGRGQRRYLRRSARTRTEARELLAELVADRRAGVMMSKLSLGVYLRRWLDDSAQPTISANTYRGYEDVIAHLAPIADVPLAALSAEDIERCCNAMRSRRGRVSAPASPKTIRNAQIMLRRALGQAEARGHVRRNVARLVPLRRVPRKSRDPLSPVAARAVLAAVTGDRYEAGYALAMLGLRQGEILGLAWDDVDLERATLAIRYQAAGSGRKTRRAQLKTEASASVVPLPAFLVELLRRHAERQRLERPVVSIDRGLVFVTPAGLGVNGSWWTKHFQSLLAKAGLPRLTIHDLRHGAASLLIGAGVSPRVAQELLRHASSKTTMEVYTHVSASQQREAAEVLERVIGGNG